MKIKIANSTFILALLLILLGGYTIYLANAYSDQDDAQILLDKEASARQVNTEFLQSLFTYSAISDRYAAIQPLMTEKGYSAIAPAQKTGELESSSELDSRSSRPVQYLKVKNDKASLYSQLEVTITYEGEETKQPVLAYTELIFINDTWKIDHFEIIHVIDEDVQERDHD